MSLSSSRHVPWVLALWFAATACLSNVYAQGTFKPRRSLELSETNSAEILTNLNRLSTKKEGITELDERLRSLKRSSPDATFEANWYAPYAAPSSSGLPNKALKELLQRQVNWGLSLEEIGVVRANSKSENFSIFGDDKADRDRKSSLQQFYDGLNNRTLDRKTEDGSSDPNFMGSKKRLEARRDLDAEDDSNLPEGIRDKAKKLKDMVYEDSTSIFSPTRGRSSFDNFFGLKEETPMREPAEAPKAGSESFIDQFKKTLDQQSAASGLGSGLNSLLPNADSASRSALVPGLEPFVASMHQMEQTPGGATTLADPTALRDLNSSVLNQWNPMYQAPKLELPKPPAPASTTVMQVPRRRF